MSKLAIEFGLLEPIRPLIAERHAGLRLVRRHDHAGQRGARRPARPARLRRHRHDGAAQRVRPSGRLVRGDGELDGVDGGAFHAVFIRAPWVERVGAERRGAGAGRARVPPPVGLWRFGSANLLATAFHPELTGDLRVHRFFVDMVRERARSERRGRADVRPFKVGDDQAQEGGRRRPARQAVRPPDQERRGGGPDRRR